MPMVELYKTPMTFLWAPNTSHTIASALSFDISNDIKCIGGGGWTTVGSSQASTGTTQTIYVTGPASYASPSSYSYRLAVVMGSGGLGFDCNGTAFATINGTCVDKNTFLWEPAGTDITASLRMPAGYAFTGWGEGFPATSTMSFKMNGPVVLDPQWQPSAHFTLKTNPAGMKIMVDHAVVTTPVKLDWAPNSAHSLSPVSPQTVGTSSKEWVFESWSDGGQENRIVTAPGSGQYGSITVKYSLGAVCGFRTTPSGLSLTIDGRSNWLHYDFVWPVGSKHTISAPLSNSMRLAASTSSKTGPPAAGPRRTTS